MLLSKGTYFLSKHDGENIIVIMQSIFPSWFYNALRLGIIAMKIIRISKTKHLYITSLLIVITFDGVVNILLFDR